MIEIVIEINQYIKDKKLTHKLRIFSDGEKYFLMYQSIFAPNTDSWESIASAPVENYTYNQLTQWVDLIVDQVAEGLQQA